MRLILSYDIATPDKAGHRRLQRVARLMERYGVRVQKSVFECALNETRLQKLLLELEPLLVMECDSVIMYPIGECCSGKVMRLGAAPPEPFRSKSFVL